MINVKLVLDYLRKFICKEKVLKSPKRLLDDQSSNKILKDNTSIDIRSKLVV